MARPDEWELREEPNGASTSSAMSEQGDWNKAGRDRNMKSENCVKPAGAAMRALDDKEHSTLCARSHASTQASMHQKRVNEAYGMIVGRLENIRSNSSTLNLLILLQKPNALLEFTYILQSCYQLSSKKTRTYTSLRCNTTLQRFF